MAASDDLELHREFGELKGRFDAMTTSVDKLTNKVEELTNALNQAKGAKLALFTIPAVVGGVGGVLSYFGIHLSAGH